MYKTLLSSLLIISALAFSQTEIPESYSNLLYSNDTLVFKYNNKNIASLPPKAKYKYSDIVINPIGTEKGLKYNFNNKKLQGTVYYGFINSEDGNFEYPVYFKETAKIINGIAEINILNMSGKYDMIDWELNKKGTIGYRIVDNNGMFIYDGVVNFKYNNAFVPAPTIIEGPFISNVKSNEVTIWFKTNYLVKTTMNVNNIFYNDEKTSYFHQYIIKDLESFKKYNYIITCNDFTYEYNFKTSPKEGERIDFTFAYASDSRTGQGGGERNIFGVNAYILKKIAAYATKENVAFMQFSGDLINGYSNSKDEINLQYANWKKAVGPYSHYIPVYLAQGNHEAISNNFYVKHFNYPLGIDKFPFETESAEAVFAQNFVLPKSNLISEDGAIYDPNPKTTDFPPYNETVYYYTYSNTAMVVLNSNYWYATLLELLPETSGNIHGYIMDNQLNWLKETLLKLENNDNIDNVFVTIHTPAFPNGGHSQDDMWYGGNNNVRALVANKPLTKGIIERRDEFLDIIVNKNTKVVALLTGDEHNYCKLLVSDKMKRYPLNYKSEKLKLNRIIYQINNGAAGAPYYAQEELPWSEYTSGFTTQNALVLINVNGNNINVKVVNPDTLEEIEHFKLK